MGSRPSKKARKKTKEKPATVPVSKRTGFVWKGETSFVGGVGYISKERRKKKLEDRHYTDGGSARLFRSCPSLENEPTTFRGAGGPPEERK